MPLSGSEQSSIRVAIEVTYRDRGIRDARRGLRALSEDQRASAEQARRFGVEMQAAGTAMMTAAGSIAVALGGMTAETAIFREQLALASTQALDSAVTVDRLAGAARSTASEFGVSLGNMGQVAFDMFSTIDATMGQVPQLFDDFARAAVAGGAEMEQVARQTMNLMNAFQIPAEEVTSILDAQASAVQFGTMTLDDFNQNMGQISPAAISAGQGIDEAAGSFAFLTRMGLNASMASTSTARALELLTRSDVINRLEDVGITMRDLHGELLPIDDILRQMHQQMQGMTRPEMFEQMDEWFAGAGNRIQARRFFQLALENFELLETGIDRVRERAFTVDDQFEIMGDTVAFQARRAWQAFTAFRQEIGDQFMPVAASFVGWIADAAAALANLDDSTMGLIGDFAGMSAAALGVGGAIAFLTGTIVVLQASITLLGITWAQIISVGARVTGVVGTLVAVLAVLGLNAERVVNILGTLSHGLSSTEGQTVVLIASLGLLVRRYLPSLINLFSRVSAVASESANAYRMAAAGSEAAGRTARQAASANAALNASYASTVATTRPANRQMRELTATTGALATRAVPARDGMRGVASSVHVVGVEANRAAGQAGRFASAKSAARGAATRFTGAMAAMRPVVRGVGNAFSSLLAVVGGPKGAALIAGIAGVVAIIGRIGRTAREAEERIDSFSDALMRAAEAGEEFNRRQQVVETLEDMRDSVDGFFSHSDFEVLEDYNIGIRELTNAFLGGDEAVGRLREQIRASAMDTTQANLAIHALDDVLGDLSGTVSSAEQDFVKMAEAQFDIARGSENVRMLMAAGMSRAEAYGEIIASNSSEFDTGAEALDHYGIAVDGASDSMEEASPHMELLGESASWAGERITELADSMEHSREAAINALQPLNDMFSAFSDAATDDELGITQALSDSRQELEQFIADTQTLQDAGLDDWMVGLIQEQGPEAMREAVGMSTDALREELQQWPEIAREVSRITIEDPIEFLVDEDQLGNSIAELFDITATRIQQERERFDFMRELGISEEMIHAIEEAGMRAEFDSLIRQAMDGGKDAIEEAGPEFAAAMHQVKIGIDEELDTWGDNFAGFGREAVEKAIDELDSFSMADLEANLTISTRDSFGQTMDTGTFFEEIVNDIDKVPEETQVEILTAIEEGDVLELWNLLEEVADEHNVRIVSDTDFSTYEEAISLIEEGEPAQALVMLIEDEEFNTQSFIRAMQQLEQEDWKAILEVTDADTMPELAARIDELTHEERQAIVEAVDNGTIDELLEALGVLDDTEANPSAAVNDLGTVSEITGDLEVLGGMVVNPTASATDLNTIAAITGDLNVLGGMVVNPSASVSDLGTISRITSDLNVLGGMVVRPTVRPELDYSAASRVRNSLRSINRNISDFNSGGRVPGPNINRDIVPAALTPGEWVINREAVRKFGHAAMQQINQGRAPVGLNSGGPVSLRQSGPTGGAGDVSGRPIKLYIDGKEIATVIYDPLKDVIESDRHRNTVRGWSD